MYEGGNEKMTKKCLAISVNARHGKGREIEKRVVKDANPI